MLIHLVFIHTSFLFLLKFAILEVSCPWRGACARKSGRGCCPCKAANENCNANCQSLRRSCNEVIKRPAAGHGLKIINVRQSDIFPCFSSKFQNIYTQIFYLYLQSSSTSRQPKNFERDVSCKPCIQSTKPSKRLTLRNFSMTRLDTFPK